MKQLPAGRERVRNHDVRSHRRHRNNVIKTAIKEGQVVSVPQKQSSCIDTQNRFLLSGKSELNCKASKIRHVIARGEWCTTDNSGIHTHLEAVSSSSQRMAKSGRDCTPASRAPTYVTVVTQAHGRGLPVSGSPQCSHSSWKLSFGDGVEGASGLGW